MMETSWASYFYCRVNMTREQHIYMDYIEEQRLGPEVSGPIGGD